ncbi:alpha/beta hydrolase family protein [Kitasatospora sp. HPMI-4]|uniref:alpha/beta hydrolase family protein n=1 Tax=Kitasatospora sp. HPMI-4 TaxID=3448443 RepID=UPI003F19EF4B
MLTNRRRLAASAIVALSVSATVLAGTGAAFAEAPHAGSISVTSATTQAATQYALPAPTGPYAAGEDVLHLTDTSRLDPWMPSAGFRQLTVSMFYPAHWETGQPAPYMSLGEAQNFVALRLKPNGFGSTTPEEITAMWTNAFTGAKAAPGKFPLVVLSPGLGNPRGTLTALATELASHGYVVALVGHPYEDSGEQLADGSIAPCLCLQAKVTDALAAQIIADRGVDVKFVVDQLTGGHVWDLSHLIDKRSIGMAGHSIGGAAAAAAMQDDPRIQAGVNLDGTFLPAIPSGALGGRSFMLFGGQGEHSEGGGDQTWNDSWRSLTGYKRWFAVSGENHNSFSDFSILAEDAGVSLPGQTLDGFRSLQITRDYVTAFFDKTLKGMPEPLLDGNSPAYPEVAAQP